MLFGKLQQGVQENEQMVTVARLRADAEDTYAQRLGDIEVATNRIEGGFQRDDGASVKKVSTSNIAVSLGSGIDNTRHTKVCGQRWVKRVEATGK